MQASLIDATQSTSRLREDVQSLTDWVSSGVFTEQLQRRIGTSATGKGDGVCMRVVECMRARALMCMRVGVQVPASARTGMYAAPHV